MKYFLLILTFLFGCTSTSDLQSDFNLLNNIPNKDDGKYDSFYPQQESSEYLDEIIGSVKLVNSISFYEVYLFDKEKRILKDRINEAVYQRYYSTKSDFTNTASGTATIIFLQSNKVGLITCAHIVDMPDTLITYHREKDGTGTDYIESYSIKKSQSNYVVEFPGSGNIDLIASDRAKDIAYMGKEFENEKILPLNEFSYPLGDAEELGWGTFTYVFGYPLNFRMISRAIVSSPLKDDNSSFLLDAVFNRGMSGGIILALRDGIPNFELIGMVQSVPGDREFILKPSVKNSKTGYNPNIPYNGEIFVDEFKNIKYGITKVVSVNSIKNFFNEQSSLLREKGFYPDSLLSR